ncbi:MAG: phenylalanine--tRNA ligase subunit alpha [Anaerolineaceae bacterium]|nr:phenylalanine--tRNA ligase subunit alpha [Anaerolineaceae bacterium]
MIREQAIKDLEGTVTGEMLENWRQNHLTRRAGIAQVLKQLPTVPPEERPQVGQFANQVKKMLEEAFNAREEVISKLALQKELNSAVIDVTLPGRKPNFGRLHPASQTLREINRTFMDMGFQVYRSPDVETDEYNFELLNIPAHHPARDMWDTFFTKTPGTVLRTHTSPGQIHAMRENAPEPIRVILPGMCYRYEQITARSEIQFNQVEVLAIGHDIDFRSFKGTLEDFAHRMFGDDARIRFRPSYFPFTEPSAEMDIECFVCSGKGCPVCKGAGWLEIMGCGMVHPVVMKNGGYDPNEFKGFAAGLGPERITMLRHKISDIRYFWSNDIRFLEQF